MTKKVLVLTLSMIASSSAVLRTPKATVAVAAAVETVAPEKTLSSIEKARTLIPSFSSIKGSINTNANAAWEKTAAIRQTCSKHLNKMQTTVAPYATKKNVLIAGGTAAAVYLTYRTLKWALSDNEETKN